MVEVIKINNFSIKKDPSDGPFLIQMNWDLFRY